MTTPKKPAEKATDVARRIWLAGVGAYGQAVDDAQETVNRVTKETGHMFEELVSKGVALENKLSDSGVPTRKEAMQSVEDRLDRMRGLLGLNVLDRDQANEIKNLSEQIEKLSAKVDALSAQSTGKPAAKAKTKAAPKAKAKAKVKTKPKAKAKAKAKVAAKAKPKAKAKSKTKTTAKRKTTKG
ncbi:MAG: putative Rdx family selenoprotein [Parvibaculaceae bacterium]|jgi:predicted Rdx family selenoprotein|tara:strand:+ start:179 stop:730 length:552 start_codon:yes stop_codon:yes gene_type:complete